jgi:homoserine kinase
MGVSVFAPASVANLAVGYDSLGLCLDGPGDEVYAEFSDTPGITIASIQGDGGKLPLTPAKNTAGRAAQAVLEAVGNVRTGVSLKIQKKMPFGSGMGSSSASAVAGAMAVNELLDRPFSKYELLKFTAMGEQVADGAWHLDNVAPSLLGGIVLVRDGLTLDVQNIPVPDGLRVCVVHPDIEILTKDSRAILSDTVALDDVIKQQSNLGGLIIGLYNNDHELIGRSFKDHIIEPQRSKLIPHFYELQSEAFDLGALGCSISGAGPSVFAFCPNADVAENCGVAISSIWAKHGITCQVHQSGINPVGAKVI